MSDVIQKEVDGSKGSYVLTRDGATAKLTFSVVSAHKIIVDHTEVPASLRGTGAGVALFQKMVMDARIAGIKIVPLCPFVNAQRRRHPEFEDVFDV
ncbi:GNAT family N-acetyltransferase [Pseudoruegeria sp. SK021]|uniref:GNAT family N-acetyltransferase n=1 Tax=Pseudoruegeria sp. SK021 TaxID=1933035 RepID=UPI000A25BBFB|nr:GNAT family N-acetyltransferase [Pseudoruegeria sp. SK021]OSP56526.1 N-acetyltransferase [Pseudoruegeria sp. SK021]